MVAKDLLDCIQFTKNEFQTNQQVLARRVHPFQLGIRRRKSIPQNLVHAEPSEFRESEAPVPGSRDHR